ncbi:tyrosine-type recombinase/integrase [Acidithiobacillus sulfurivorans]|uniref:Tyrosine-type recombinase/integrase n=1 Tax=Acidithiobacillus sulfurivorans TaxID=1958756 RepID=A0ABS6A147_9PROT|nr:tyrosine-type recombinase/integrase [Acidithiobacillus sulfurivorans]
MPIAANRTLGVQSPSKERQKDRVLNDEEIVLFWKCLDPAAMSLMTKLALRFMLVTGQRLGEVCHLTREQIDGNWWIMPAEFAKNGRAHRVALSPLAMSILNEAQFMGIERYLFPSLRVTEEGRD